VPTSDQKTYLATEFVGSRHFEGALFLHVVKFCTDLYLTLLHSLIHKTYTKFVWKDKMPAICVCLLQPCSRASRRFAASRSCISTTDESFRCHNNELDEIRCNLDSTENLRSFEKYSTPPESIRANKQLWKGRWSVLKPVKQPWPCQSPVALLWVL